VSIVALVLVGGMGTRLRSVVADRPKALAEILGRPFLAWQLDFLARQGVERAVLCTHYQAGMIEAVFPAGRLPNGLVVSHSREPEPQGTGGALRLGLDSVGAEVAEVLAVNGDTFCRFDLAALWSEHHHARATATLLLTRVEDVSRYGAVEAGDDGLVTAFREKAASVPGPGWINAGLCVVSSAALGAVPADRPISMEREVFPAWIGKGLHAFPGGSHFLDIGTPESFAEAERYLKSVGEG